ncbi:MAG: Formate dehydrogenase O putative subunit [uncultured Rubrobacteraceae bacterium]|uniref:Formate dehydrogenase O putative subunit n=1 Tax=uncultured Rubrobacteraceae bacterium TaxID=349277 RepID=A0A6J4SHK3_9ACTN|nr:MAG: Formate dehydrogenase O putative subunit [uncultured Rubrobacteraceae bacterium]
MSDTTRQDLTQSNGHVTNGRPETSHHPETDPKREDKHYYGIPPIKHAHWTWQIPVYFWIGGIGAGTHLFSTVAQLLGHEDAALKRASRYTVLVSMILSPIFLIWDLGRPERFYNMMRILKLRSPMSTQSWSLLAFGNFGGVLAARQMAEDGLLGSNVLSRLLLRLVPERLLSVIALPFGLFVGFNTGNLISATSVPIWARNWALMAPTFLASGTSTALSWLSLVLHLTRSGKPKTLHALHRAEKATIVIEAGLIAASLVRMGRWGRPLFSKSVAPLFVGGTLLAGIAAPFALLFSGRETRGKSVLSSVLVLLGGLAFRFAIIRAGRISADDPEAYFTFASGESAPQPEDKV